MTTIFLLVVGNVKCALHLQDVPEILPLPRLARWPELPQVVEGFFDLGGEAIAAVDAARLFGIAGRLQPGSAEFAYRHMVMLDAGQGQQVALVVDRVLDAREIDQTRIMPVSHGFSLNGCVAGEVEIDGEIVHLLDPAAIFSAREQALLDELGAQAKARDNLWQGGAPA